jgi:uncharacterized delta-60 repeat protein
MFRSFFVTLLCVLSLWSTAHAAPAAAARRMSSFDLLRQKLPAQVYQLLLERQGREPLTPARSGKESRRAPAARMVRSMTGASSAWSSEYGSGIAPAQDAAFDLAMTPDGNIAVTGYSTGSATGADILTTLYDPSGARIWSARYDGPDHGDDVGVAVAVDDSGNVYVAGRTAEQGLGWDMAVIKYEAGGTLAWSAGIDLTLRDDLPVDIAVNAGGQVYIASTVAASPELQPYGSYDDDIYLEKFSRDGDELWNEIYDGPANKTDRVAGMALDASGNVFLVGSTLGASGENYVALKYSAAGSLLGQATYDGSAGDDEATAVAVDADGFVYVTGWSAGSGTDKDIATLKYDNDLFGVWSVRYNGPANSSDGGTAIAVNDSGSVFVTGWSIGSGGSFDIVTMKLASNSTLAWTVRYDGASADLDISTALVLDGSSNVYVAGSSYASATADDILVLKYNVSGAPQTEKHYNGTGNAGDYATRLLVDVAGNIYVTGFSDGGGTGSDATLLKYSTTGTTDWADRYDGPGNSFDRPAAIAMDAGGNVYVAGQSDGVLTAADFLLLKYDAAGVLVWDVRLDGTSSSFDYITAMTLDGAGAVYVTGYSAGDYLTVKFNGSGQQLWSARYDGPANSTDFATAVGIDASGNCVVTGRSYGSDGSSDVATIKYNAVSGNALWIARYAGPGAADDYATALKTDASGNIYVTGYTGAYPANDYLTIRYDAAGTEKWTAKYNGTGNSDDGAVQLALLPNGRLVVTGRSFASGGSYDIVTLAYDTANGSPAWTHSYNGSGNVSDDVRDMAIDHDGNVILTGASGAGSSSDLLVLKLNGAGSQLWATTLGGSDEDAGTTVTVDRVGNVYAAGYSYRSAAWSDLLWVKFSPTGSSTGENYYDSPNLASDVAVDAILDNVGNLVVAAQSYGVASSWITTAEFGQALTNIQAATASWNMLSLPLTVASPLKTDLYPTAISDAFSYSQTGYVSEDTILPRLGYWLKFGFGQNLTLSGEQRLLDTFALRVGWNLIGSIAYPLLTANVVQTPGGIVVSPYFAYSITSGYTAVDTLKPFLAYWVKASTPGSLILDLKNPQQSPAQIANNDVAGLNELTVLPNGASAGARLLFGRPGGSRLAPERFALPPVPPADAFDARFASERSMAIVPDEGTGELPLRIQGVKSGVILRWEIREADARYVLVERANGVIVAEHGMTGSGQITIALGADRTLSIESGAIPQRYELSQNFPNPFNPSTVIGYQLPVSGPVRLVVFNALGQEVATLVNGVEEAGYKSVTWNAGNAPSGVYYCRLTAGGLMEQKKMLLVK